MSYPAYESFAKAKGIDRSTWRVYMALQPPTLAFHAPKLIKVSYLVYELHMSSRDVIAALNRLVAAGYLIESRGERRTRYLVLAYTLERSAA